ncbi:Glycosyltransferase family 9 protein [uncultured Gammaproteobacteria bacterium]
MRILYITSNRLGDAVLSTGLLGHLVETKPEAHFTIACGPLAASIFRTVPRLERLISLAKRKHKQHWLELWRESVFGFWHLVVDLRNTPVSRLITTRRVAVLPRPRPGWHRVEQIAATLGVFPPPLPRLWFSPEQSVLAQTVIPEGPPVLAIAPAANWGGKTWRVERFAELARALTAPDGILPGARVAVLASAGERPQAQPVLDALAPGQGLDLIGHGDPLQAAAYLARCALFVGNDSGLMHLAAATGMPTLGLFGPSRPEHYAPRGRCAGFVTTPETCDQITAAPDYDYRSHRTLMDTLCVPAVLEAAHSLWHRAILSAK